MLSAFGLLALRGVACYRCVYGIDFGLQFWSGRNDLPRAFACQTPTARHLKPNINHIPAYYVHICD